MNLCMHDARMLHPSKTIVANVQLDASSAQTHMRCLSNLGVSLRNEVVRHEQFNQSSLEAARPHGSCVRSCLETRNQGNVCAGESLSETSIIGFQSLGETCPQLRKAWVTTTLHLNMCLV